MGRIECGGGDGGDPARGPPSRDYPIGQTCENYLAKEPERLTPRKDASAHQRLTALRCRVSKQRVVVVIAVL